ncbi:hypothetical protein [Phaeovulum sp. W22_SRMD_FR3]|uniref:hypothetical protein n=1 Tax=Phaeovulum sp. W22_SRMD_FR3 TaxID=3240274 RepID=UPI003F966CA2
MFKNILLGMLADLVRSPGTTVKLLLFPLLTSVLFLLASIIPLTITIIALPNAYSVATLFWGICLFLVAVFGTLWQAVLWHRYAILLEMPGRFRPRWHGTTTCRFALRSIQIYALSSVAGSLALMPAIVLLHVIPPGLSPLAVAIAIIGAICLVIVAGGIQRLTICLPATAVRHPLSPGAAWAATRGLWPTMIGLSAMICGVGLSIELLTAEMLADLNNGTSGGGPFIGLILTVWLVIPLVFVALLSATYREVLGADNAAHTPLPAPPSQGTT